MPSDAQVLATPPWRLPVPLRAVTTAALLALGGLWPHEAHSDASREYDLKAVLLYHFTQFVEWPPTSFAGADTPLVIGILGHDPFGPVLDDLVRQETHDHRRIVVERYRAVEAIGNCQILFISASESRALPRILAVLRGRPILTVGDFDGFDLRGGMIRFERNPDDRIGIRINLAAAKASGLTVSARLLRVAEVVAAQK